MRVLVAVAAGFSVGVFLRSLFSFGWQLVVFLFLIAALLASTTFLKSRLGYTLGAVFCLLCALGMVRAHLADTPLPQAFTPDLRKRVTYEGVVVRDPDIRETTQRVYVQVEKGGEETIVLVVAKPYPEVGVGDQVKMSGTLFKPEPFDTDGGRIFRYDKYLQRDGVRFLLSFATMRVQEEAPWHSIPAALARIKHFFLHGLDTTLPEQQAALAGGIVIGGKTGLDKDLQDAFIRSGLVHVIVLSGYNVMIVAEWMMALLALMTTSRRVRAIAGALALLLFVGIAGFSATAIRATLMALIALYARATGRTYVASRTLFVVVLLMLIWNPLYLVFDPGFGLSVTATAGLIWLSPIFEGLFLRARTRLGKREPNRVQRFWIEAVSATLAAQTGVLPLLLYNTGNLSIVALPANLLVVAVMPLAMAFAALAGTAGAFFASSLPLLTQGLALPADMVTRYVIFVAKESAALPWAALTIPAFSFVWVLLAYATIIFFASSKRFSTTAQLTLAKKAST
ncbi:MAG: ComEC/Rec2 family competence protein [Candidatus Paceibacterota bacterium]